MLLPLREEVPAVAPCSRKQANFFFCWTKERTTSYYSCNQFIPSSNHEQKDWTSEDHSSANRAHQSSCCFGEQSTASASSSLSACVSTNSTVECTNLHLCWTSSTAAAGARTQKRRERRTRTKKKRTGRSEGRRTSGAAGAPNTAVGLDRGRTALFFPAPVATRFSTEEDRERAEQRDRALEQEKGAAKNTTKTDPNQNDSLPNFAQVI